MGYEVNNEKLEESDDSEHNRRVEQIKLEDELGHAECEGDKIYQVAKTSNSVMKKLNAKQDKHMLIIK